MDWQPIETAPKDGSRIILGRNGLETGVGFWQDFVDDGVDYQGNDAGFVDSEFQVFYPGRSFGPESQRYPAIQPTHWMPLPPPPPKD